MKGMEADQDEEVGFNTTSTPMKCVECSDGTLILKVFHPLRKDGTRGNPRRFYGCTNFPQCRGVVGAHQDPPYATLGIPADQATRELRKQVHAVLDPLWRKQPSGDKKAVRGKVYAWVSQQLGTSYHTGEADAGTCHRVLALLKDKRPEDFAWKTSDPPASPAPDSTSPPAVEDPNDEVEFL